MMFEVFEDMRVNFGDYPQEDIDTLATIESGRSLGAVNQRVELYGFEVEMSGDMISTIKLCVPEMRNTHSTALFANTTEARLYPDRTTPEARAHEWANKIVAARRAVTHTALDLNRLAPLR